MSNAQGQRRLRRLMLAGWVDSVCLSFAWTLLILEVVERHGLRAAGLAGAAMLIGTALSAPVASHLSMWLGGRQLLRTAAAAESLLRVGVFTLLVMNAGMWSLVVCIAVMNITAWTGYAGMRAEVASVAPGPKALTLYGTGVAAVEALGAAGAAFVPASAIQGPSLVVVVIVVVYVLALLPTVIVAGGSTIEPARALVREHPRATRPSLPLVAGVLLMSIASAPTLLAVALAAELHGRDSVPAVAVAFTVGSLTAPYLSGRVERRTANGPAAWILCAVGMVLLWPLAPWSVAALCGAQLLSGLFMTTLEGLLDATAAAHARSSVTGALARATAGRAFGSAAGTAALPFGVATLGLSAVTGGAAFALLSGAMVVTGWNRFGDPAVGAAAPRHVLTGARRLRPHLPLQRARSDVAARHRSEHDGSRRPPVVPDLARPLAAGRNP